MNIRDTEPDVFDAGDTVQWRKNAGDYPPPTWTLKYSFVSKSGVFAATAADDNGNYLITLTPAETAIIVPDLYRWNATVTDGAARHTIATGTTRVNADLAATASAADTRSHARQMLDALEKAQLVFATTDQASYTLPGGVSISRKATDDMLRMYSHWKWQVALEENADRARKGLPPTWTIGVRM